MARASFPKSLNVGKAIDKMAGADREVVGQYDTRSLYDGAKRDEPDLHTEWREKEGRADDPPSTLKTTTAPATEAAKQWDGWGSAVKPAHEPIVLARKPLQESSIARQVLATGTGALNIDACRVGFDPTGYTQGGCKDNYLEYPTKHKNDYDPQQRNGTQQHPQGRFPSNLLLSHDPACQPTGEVRRVKGIKGGNNTGKTNVAYGEYAGLGGKANDYADPDGTEAVPEYRCVESCPVRLMDEQSGQLKSPEPYERKALRDRAPFDGGMKIDGDAGANYGDKGGASRFFQQFSSESDTDENGCVGGCPIREMDEQSGNRPGSHKQTPTHSTNAAFGGGRYDNSSNYSDEGGASRFFQQFQPDVEPGFLELCEAGDPSGHPGFFYKSKASRRERNLGLEGMPEKPSGVMQDDNYKWTHNGKGNPINLDTKMQNPHPTVKPIALMRYLCRLITPPNGTILDPFAGSGSTGCAAVQEGFNFIGIEKDESYCEIARKRIAYWSQPEAQRQKGKTPAKERTTHRPKIEPSEPTNEPPATLF